MKLPPIVQDLAEPWSQNRIAARRLCILGMVIVGAVEIVVIVGLALYIIALIGA